MTNEPLMSPQTTKTELEINWERAKITLQRCAACRKINSEETIHNSLCDECEVKQKRL